MKIKDLTKELIGYSKTSFDVTCDTIKEGNEDNEITGIGVSMFATPDVIRYAKENNINFLIVHEPVYYEHMDEEIPYEIGFEKQKLIKESGLTIFRFHDHAHGMKPDLICEGQLKLMNLKGTFIQGEYFGVNRFLLDEPMTAEELGRTIKKNLGLSYIRIAGCTNKKGQLISCCFGTPSHIISELEECDFVLIGEISEWAFGEVARDFSELGYNKAYLVMEHIGSEYGGMKLLAERFADKYKDFKTEYIDCKSVYTYV